MNKKYQVVKNGVIKSGKISLPIFYDGINNFNNLSDSKVAEYGYYLVIEEPITPLHKLVGGKIDNERKEIKYFSVPKSKADLDAEIKNITDIKYMQLWQSAHDYEYAQISGSAIGMLTVLTLVKNPKAIAVQKWIQKIWAAYYEQKTKVTLNHEYDPVIDFSVIGDIPHTIPELMAEYELLLRG